MIDARGYCIHGLRHDSACRDCPNETAHAHDDPTPTRVYGLTDGRRLYRQAAFTLAQVEIAQERAHTASGGTLSWIAR